MHIQEPFIETLYAQPKLFVAGASYDALGYTLDPLLRRKKAADNIIKNGIKGGKTWLIYLYLEEIMSEYPRLSLYIPFEILEKAPDGFKDSYLCAWRECWAFHDYRELFNLGDIYEKEASSGEPERIVKAMHLVPYLVKFGYISTGDVLNIMKYMRNDNLLRWSLMDAVEVLRSWGLIDSAQYRALKGFKLKPRQQAQKLLYETDARKKWLEEMANNYGVTGKIELKNPTGPFIRNINAAEILKGRELKPDCYYLIGGSRLKGYGRDNSDFDIYEYDAKSGCIRGMEPLSNHPGAYSHLILDTVWVGENVVETVKAQFSAAERCFCNEAVRRESLERTEMDLLQFRLMHKGIPCAYPELFNNPKKKAPIDDNSAFYKDEYRYIAMQLFVKYIILPEKA